ncbi:tail completion protein gp17 [Azorhizophilus paspali]
MYPPIFARISADAGVTALLGAPPAVRFFLFGQAPQNVQKPYAVWRLAGGGAPTTT